MIRESVVLHAHWKMTKQQKLVVDELQRGAVIELKRDRHGAQKAFLVSVQSGASKQLDIRTFDRLRTLNLIQQRGEVWAAFNGNGGAK